MLQFKTGLKQFRLPSPFTRDTSSHTTRVATSSPTIRANPRNQFLIIIRFPLSSHRQMTEYARPAEQTTCRPTPIASGSPSNILAVSTTTCTSGCLHSSSVTLPQTSMHEMFDKHLLRTREPLSKAGLSGYQAAGRLQGPEIGPESAGAARIRGVSGGPRPCGGRLRPLWGACSPRQAARQGAARNRLWNPNNKASRCRFLCWPR